MNIKEFMEKNLQLNEKDKKKKIVLIFIASLLAMAAAIYSVFHTRKSDQDGAEKSVKAKRQSKVNKSSVSKQRHVQSVSKRKSSAQSKKEADETEHEATTVVQRPVATVPRQVYIVRPLPKEKQESKPHRFKRHMCAAVAVILVVSLVGSGAMNYVQPTTVLAKGSFSGIGRIVEEHGEDNPYVILDIVPSTAKYKDTYEFSTGTMGYLVSGQAAIVNDLRNVLVNNTDFWSYDARQTLLDNVTNNGAFPEVSYKEAYAGIDTITSDMIPMFVVDPAAPSGDSGSSSGANGYPELDGPNGAFTGKVEYVGASQGNFDVLYINSSSGAFTGIAKTNSLDGGLYLSNPGSGEYQVLFGAKAASDEAEGGYVVKDTINPDVAADASSVYILSDDGIYQYWGTVEAWNEMIEGARSAYEEIFYESGEEAGNSDESHQQEESHQQDEWIAPTEPTVEENNESASTMSAPISNRWYKLVELESEIAAISTEDPSATSSGDTGSGDTSSGDTGSGDTGSGDTGSGDTGGGDTGSGDTGSGDTGSGDTGGGDTGSGDTGGGDTGSGDTGSGDTGSGDTGNSGEAGDSDDEEKDNDNDDNTKSEDEEDPEANEEEPNEGEEPKENPEPENPEPEKPQIEIDWDSFWSQFDKYRVVIFEYESDPYDGQQLYDIIAETPSEGSPYDAYDLIETADYGIATLALEIELPNVDANNVDGVFSYVGEGNGAYKIERVSSSSIITGSESNVGTVEVRNTSIYYRCSSSKDYLKQYVFSTLSGGDNASDNFNITVNTVRWDNVTSAMIAEADLIYLESGQGNTVLNSNVLTSEYFIEDELDVSGAIVGDILRRVTEDLTPIIVDYDITKNNTAYQETSYQYLAMALLKRDVAEFYEAISGNDLMANLRTNIDTGDYPDVGDNNNNYVNQNIYIVNDSSPLVSEDFPNSFDDDKARAGFSDVLAAIKAENTMLAEEDKIPETVSKARAVQYIINFSVGIVGDFGDLRILELQPTANTGSDLSVVSGSGEGAKLVWKTPSMTTAKQVISSKKSFSIDTDVKSVVEFNSEWEDINGIYDFVFIGLDGRRLNVDDEGKTVYNDPALNGKVYHTGDYEYDDNDITAQKMTNLLDFMAAGYPILVESNCFKDGTAQKAEGEGDINTDYIDRNSVMYNFLRAALENYGDFIYTVSDAMAGSMFITQIKMAKPRISLVEDENGSASAYKSVNEDINGEFHGRIAYEVTSNKSTDDGYGEYYGNTVVRLYADVNYDGIFTDAEALTEYSNEGGVIDVDVTGMGPGILPWKLEVSAEGNPSKRDSVEGYFAIGSSATSARGEMNVLQIVANRDNEYVNLQTMFHKSTDSELAACLSGGESILNVNMQFETITPAELESRLAEHGTYLEQWDVVVVTLEDLELGNTVTAINEYVGKGRSLLVCGSATSSENRAGLDGGLLGQAQDRTYVQLGALGNYHRYADMNDGMYAARQGLQAERVNEGSISYYPYSIEGSSFSIGTSVDVKASAYLLDFENNLKSEENVTYVTPWYTIGGDSSTAYGISPRDGRNNYYCYSKGNMVYLAQSSYPYTTGAGIDECKFFVNALVAAYSAGIHNANVHIVAGFAVDSADVESIAVPYDDVWITAADDNTGGILDNTVDVYFRFRDSNIAMNKIVEIQFLYEDESEGTELPVGGKTVKAQTFESPIWMVENNRLTLVEGDQLEPGKTYRIQAPVVTLQKDSGANKADIYVVIKTSFTRNGRSFEGISSDSVSLNRAQLFELE